MCVCYICEYVNLINVWIVITVYYKLNIDNETYSL